MSLPSQGNSEKSKHQTAAMKEGVQHSGEVYYNMGPPALKPGLGDSSSSSGVYNPEKGPQSLPLYPQQSTAGKWMQDSMQAPSWSQEAPVQTWGPSFSSYSAGVNVRGQMGFPKGVHEGVAMAIGGENQLPAPGEVYREASQTQGQGRLDWEQHAAMHQGKLQGFQHGHASVELQGQPHVQAHAMQPPMLQPFQTSFRPNKQQFPPGYYSVFPGNKPMGGLGYSDQPKAQQQQLLHQMQQQQQMHHHQQQQQQLQQQHHIQLQQQHQHLQQQQMQSHQMQQLQMQQQFHHQQQLQERQQQMKQIQQLQQQNALQQETMQSKGQGKQQTQSFGSFQPPDPRPADIRPNKDEILPAELQLQPEIQPSKTLAGSDPCSDASTKPLDGLSNAPRRSRRLSRDGQSPLNAPSANIWSQPSSEPPQNGVAGAAVAKGGEGQAATGGVIQVTRRRRRASKEINLETLAQKASEMESLPAKTLKEECPSGRQAAILPLVIPVSVPVHRNQADSPAGWTQGRHGQVDRITGHPGHKPSVIVARRRSLRNSITESYDQDEEHGLSEDGKAKYRRRPRPEPLIIPPPKASTFIPASVYSSITAYQSNLRSPVRLPDNPHALPPYTPPPILSPVRTGTGLYFSTFLTNIAASNQIVPPPATPKSAVRSLLHSASSDMTPPILPLITDATPVSLEPRINIGQRYQAEIPDLQDPLSSQFDHHKANLVWLPLDDSSLKHGNQETMGYLMKVACSSVFRGGGTNQELVLHCLHDCRGDFLETLERLMLQDAIFSKEHPLANYHYSGSDSWTADEKTYFNKGISAYRKDFSMVQKLVQTKSVAQCVEFYYTYKKQVKIGRNSVLTFGPPNSPLEKHTEAVVDVKSSHQSRFVPEEAEESDKKAVSFNESYDSIQQANAVRSLQVHDYAGTDLIPDAVSKEIYQSTVPHRPRGDAAAKKNKPPTKPPPDPDAVFPCKKCGRVFNKVKSRSAHMKSHAEQEKKAAALRQREEEEQAARAREEATQRAGNGMTQQTEVSSQEDTSEDEDNDDEDWH